MTKRSRKSQPILSIPRSPVELALEVVAAVGILWGCWIIFQSWDALPQRIPIHFGFSGRPDAWGDKVAIWILPAVAAFFEVMWAVLGNYPHTFNYPVAITEENARVQYQLARSLLAWLKVEMIWLFVWILWQQIQVSLGKEEMVSVGFVLSIIMVFLGTFGVYFKRAFLAR
ncbi:DUF1648 domain-containing protein [Kamptonema sp. UHCC 0994]|uniref:DUF1648 domain-containing protein n=1 Tax=Kamptonema sp. UHCC 0994 TaxID=3031329 RepID=UPI0023B93DC6|nr:DUF1648 domain-containing protein [Kamptonema sp. UHCC 0994]MDF0551493.1 DUF1648 domain-containing protein [Kamptonema sp. UHCC 0994]